MTNVIELAKQAGCPEDFIGLMILEEAHVAWIERFTVLVGNAKLEEAKQLFSQPHQKYFGREAQDAIESLKEPTP